MSENIWSKEAEIAHLMRDNTRLREALGYVRRLALDSTRFHNDEDARNEIEALAQDALRETPRWAPGCGWFGEDEPPLTDPGHTMSAA